MHSPIAFHPASVLFETANHAELLEKVGVRALVSGLLDELLVLANAQGCTFPADFKETTIRQMTQPQETNSTMWMDFEAKRPMEIETYLGSPLKLALEVDVAVPRIETMYATLHHLNIANRNRPAAGPTPVPAQNMQHPPPPPRLSSAPLPRGPPGMNGAGPMMNGNGPMKGGPPRPGSRAPSVTGVPPMMRRGPPPGMNGYPPRMMNGGPNGQRRPSLEASDLEEFSHLMLYDDMVEGGPPGAGPYDNGAANSNSLSMRERELMIRQRELQLREQEMNMRRGPPQGQGRRPPPPQSINGFDDDDDDDDFFDPMGGRQPGPMIDPDNFDMMSVTSRRNRKVPSAGQIRSNPESGMGMGYVPGPQGRSRNPFSRPGMNKNRGSAQIINNMPGLHSSIMNDPLLGYSSNRYADVDRGAMGAQSRTNSLTASRLDDMQGGGNYGGYPTMSRRLSQSPGHPLSPGPRPMGRPSPPNGYAPNGMPPNGMPPNGMQPNGLPPNMPRNGPNGPPPPGMRQPGPPPPQQLEQHAGVSTLYPPKSRPNVRSLTGSASASAGSNSTEENSAHSSQSSLGPRPPVGVR
jgi:hypothetical protein